MTDRNPSDDRTTITELRREVQRFVADRKWEGYHTPKNLAMSIAIEAAEIMEFFQWSDSSEGEKLMESATTKARVADELADVLIYSLSFANQLNIDLSEAIHKKLVRNETRFPVERVLRGELNPTEK